MKDMSKRYASFVPERAELLKQRKYLVESFEFFCEKLGIKIPDSNSKKREEIKLKSVKFRELLTEEGKKKEGKPNSNSSQNLENS